MKFKVKFYALDRQVLSYPAEMEVPNDNPTPPTVVEKNGHKFLCGGLESSDYSVIAYHEIEQPFHWND